MSLHAVRQGARRSVASLPLLVAALFLSCAGTLGVPPFETNILLNLKNVLSPLFNPLTSWVDGNDCSEWAGVTCDVNGRVIGLDISFKAIAGEIPSFIGTLTKLQTLNLKNNYFVGEIPASLGNLADLVFLDISTTGINGSIPKAIGNLKKLQTLYLHTTQLTGPIDPSLVNLKNLKNLDISKCQITGSIPSFIGNLNQLSNLILSDNQFSGPIPPLNQLVNLNKLDLSNNQLVGVIPSINKLTNLNTLYLHSNQLTGSINTSFNGLTKLVDIDLHSNYFVGKLPTTCKSSAQCLLNANCLKGVTDQRASIECWNYCTSPTTLGNCGDFSKTLCF